MFNVTLKHINIMLNCCKAEQNHDLEFALLLLLLLLCLTSDFGGIIVFVCKSVVCQKDYWEMVTDNFMKFATRSSNDSWMMSLNWVKNWGMLPSCQ